ncbi:hypothetical protein C9374_001208 [Naegleria lovaniensis]|uniref:Uncharacterized protein n=1 Tax=Naegleria lovaniensis TaxID=51637 RepID=A0AA88GWW8_NAELO|nr:uncharacterized protein C9374_001208 [Naegleria lovaniensis]KAG2387614.1 hypothetical protein C9374_001208 [Naegleria lovaniensis]
MCILFQIISTKILKRDSYDEYALLRNFDRIFWCEFSQIKKYSQIIENQQGSRRTTVSALYDHEQPNTNTTTTSPTNNNFVPRKTLQGDEQDENLESHQVPNPFSDPSILCQEAFKSKKSWF